MRVKKRSFSVLARVFVWGSLSLISGCDRAPTDEAKSESSGAVSGRSLVCRASDQGVFRSELAGYCLDARSDPRFYGRGGEKLAEGCHEFLGDSCEWSEILGLETIQVMTYVPQQGGEQRIRITVSEFGKPRGALGAYAQRVSGGRHPRSIRAEPLDVSGRGVLRSTVSDLWQGRRVVEFRYSSESETALEKERSAERELRRVVEEFSRGLGGVSPLPYEASLLESARLIPHGIVLVGDSSSRWTGIEESAVGYCRAGDHEYRELVTLRRDEASAKDLLQFLAREHQGKWLQNKSVLRVRSTSDDRLPETWFFTRLGRLVLAVGPDEEALPASEDKDAIEQQRLRALGELVQRARRAPPPAL